PQSRGEQVSFSPDGRLILVGGNDAVFVLEAASGREVTWFPQGGQEVAVGVFLADSREIQCVGRHGDRLRADRRPRPEIPEPPTVAEEREPLRFEGQTKRANCVAFSPDGRLLATGHDEPPAVRLWDTTTGKVVHEFSGLTTRADRVAFSA